MLAVFFVTAVLPAFAAVYPPPTEEYVNDFAGVISPGDAGRIRELLARVEREAGIEITVVTIASLEEQGASSSLRRYAAGLFDSWGVGDSRRSDGVMLLFSLGDREVWVEMGAGYQSRHDAALQEVVDSRMLPYFRDGDYSRGLYEGARGVSEVVTRQVSWLSYHKWPLILSAVAAACICAGVSCMRSGKKGWGYVFFSIAGVLLLFVIKILLSGKGGRRGGFGGGRSGGGGAGGKW